MKIKAGDIYRTKKTSRLFVGREDGTLLTYENGQFVIYYQSQVSPLDWATRARGVRLNSLRDLAGLWGVTEAEIREQLVDMCASDHPSGEFPGLD